MTSQSEQTIPAGGISARARIPSYQPRYVGTRARGRIYRATMYLILTAGAITMLIPFVWLLSTSLKAQGKEFSYPPQLIPNPTVWRNYIDVLFGPYRFIRFVRNTVIVAAISVTATTLSSSIVGYGFARLPFPGRGFWFMVLLATMMLPGAVTMIPRFILFRNLGWIDTWLPLTVPAFCGTAYHIFLLRQFFQTLPYDYDEAASIDGASSLRIWWQILMPLCRPALATVVILNFMNTWGSFMEPLIYISSASKQMIGVGLAYFRGVNRSAWNLMMAAAAIQIIPLLIVFFATQQYIIKGIVMTGISGR